MQFFLFEFSKWWSPGERSWCRLRDSANSQGGKQIRNWPSWKVEKQTETERPVKIPPSPCWSRSTRTWPGSFLFSGNPDLLGFAVLWNFSKPKPKPATKAIAWKVALDPMGQGHLSKEELRSALVPSHFCTWTSTFYFIFLPRKYHLEQWVTHQNKTFCFSLCSAFPPVVTRQDWYNAVRNRLLLRLFFGWKKLEKDRFKTCWGLDVSRDPVSSGVGFHGDLRQLWNEAAKPGAGRHLSRSLKLETDCWGEESHHFPQFFFGHSTIFEDRKHYRKTCAQAWVYRLSVYVVDLPGMSFTCGIMSQVTSDVAFMLILCILTIHI